MANEKSVITFGCRLNIYESEVIKQNLKLAKLDDAVVFNTCAVTQEAERQAKQSIRKFKRDHPEIKIIVTGCAAQKNPQMFAKMQEVDKVLGNEEKLHDRYYNFTEEKVAVQDIMTLKTAAAPAVTEITRKTRAFVQIQNGCDHRCTFCIIPFARGNNRSVLTEDVITQIRQLVINGYQEVVLTGVDITGYGTDLFETPSLGLLIGRILRNIPELKRLRLSSIDVAEVDEVLLSLMINEPRLMPHFHISLQSGDNMILKRMKRRHNREQVIQFCQHVRQQRPHAAFGADIIAGFPTEKAEMFINTRNLILEAGLQYLHIFPYSAREGTPAARMPQVEQSIIHDRAKELRALGKQQVHKFMEKYINGIDEVLIEGKSKGHTTNFLPVICPENLPAGSLVKMRFSRIVNEKLVGELI